MVCGNPFYAVGHVAIFAMNPADLLAYGITVCEAFPSTNTRQERPFVAFSSLRYDTNGI